MAYTKTLLEITYHYDDDTGMYHIGEIDTATHHGELMKYLEQHGAEGRTEILAGLGYLAFQTQETFNMMCARDSSPQQLQDAKPQQEQGAK